MEKSWSRILFACLFLEISIVLYSFVKMLWNFMNKSNPRQKTPLDFMFDAQELTTILLFGTSQLISLVVLRKSFQLLESTLSDSNQSFKTTSKLKDCLLYSLPPLSTMLKESQIPLVSPEGTVFFFIPYHRIRVLLVALYPVLTTVIFSKKMLITAYTTNENVETGKESIVIGKALIVFNKLQQCLNIFSKYYLALTVLLECFSISNANGKQPNIMLTVTFWTVNSVPTTVTVTTTAILMLLHNSHRLKVLTLS